MERVVRRLAERLFRPRVGAAESLEHGRSVDLDGDRAIFGVVQPPGVVDEGDLDESEVGVVGADLGAVGADVERGEARAGVQRGAGDLGSVAVGDGDDLARLERRSRTRCGSDAPHLPVAVRPRCR